MFEDDNDRVVSGVAAQRSPQKIDADAGKLHGQYFRSAWRGEWVSITLCLFFAWMALLPESLPGLASLYYFSGRFFVPLDLVGWIRVLGLLACLFYLLRALINHYAWRYFVGPYGVESRYRFIGRDESRAEYHKISNVRVRQSLFQMMFGIGTVLIYTSASGQAEVTFHKVANPGVWKLRIQSETRVN